MLGQGGRRSRRRNHLRQNYKPPPPHPHTHKTEEPVALQSNLNQIFIEANRCFTHKGVCAHLQMPDPHLGACVVAR